MKIQHEMCFEYFCELFGENPVCELNFKSDLELLVAVILSAQCTDKRVNEVTPKLFAKYRTVEEIANADPNELQEIIHSCGFYRTKAANIIKMAKMVVSDFDGKIPPDLQSLVRLSGVGKKTANVFLAEYHNVPALAVDTHVMRVSRRLGFAKSSNPVAIERDLCAAFDRGSWIKLHKYLVLFGRYHCKAKHPLCNDCKLERYCDKV